MKIACSQCGAELTVLETEYYLRCPYCEANITLTGSEELPFLVVPAVSEEHARRLFPSKAVFEIELRYFPYADGERGPVPVFSQPFPELDGYRPPSGDRKVFSAEMVDPDQIVPADDDALAGQSLGRGSTVLHPFYLVMLAMEGFNQGVLVDGVSGKTVGPSPLQAEYRPEVPSRSFLLALLLGFPAAAAAYWLLGAAGAQGGARAFTSLLAAVGGSWAGLKLLGGRSDGNG